MSTAMSLGHKPSKRKVNEYLCLAVWTCSMWVALVDVAMPSSGEAGEDAINWLENQPVVS